MFRTDFLICIFFLSSTHGILCIYCRIYFPNSNKCTFMKVAIISSRLSRLMYCSHSRKAGGHRKKKIKCLHRNIEFLWNTGKKKSSVLWPQLFTWEPQTLICPSVSFMVMMRTVNLKNILLFILWGNQYETKPPGYFWIFFWSVM